MQQPRPDADAFRYPLADDIASCVIHAIGATLSIAALAVLVTLASLHGDPWRIVSVSIYGSTLVLLYLTSSLYHGVRTARLKRIFRSLDHASIFLLIAGTYTPFTLVSLRGPWGWTLFGLIWGFALLGIGLKTFLTLNRSKLVTASIYVAMSWTVLIAAKPFVAAVDTGGLVWVAVGGACYMLGVPFYAWRRLPYHHAIWHLFVVGGSCCHFFAVLFYVLPMSP